MTYLARRPVYHMALLHITDILNMEINERFLCLASFLAPVTKFKTGVNAHIFFIFQRIKFIYRILK